MLMININEPSDLQSKIKTKIILSFFSAVKKETLFKQKTGKKNSILKVKNFCLRKKY